MYPIFCLQLTTPLQYLLIMLTSHHVSYVLILRLHTSQKSNHYLYDFSNFFQLLLVYVEMNSEGVGRRVSQEFGVSGNAPRVSSL